MYILIYLHGNHTTTFDAFSGNVTTAFATGQEQNQIGDIVGGAHALDGNVGHNDLQEKHGDADPLQRPAIVGPNKYHSPMVVS